MGDLLAAILAAVFVQSALRRRQPPVGLVFVVAAEATVVGVGRQGDLDAAADGDPRVRNILRIVLEEQEGQRDSMLGCPVPIVYIVGSGTPAKVCSEKIALIKISRQENLTVFKTFSTPG